MIKPNRCANSGFVFQFWTCDEFRKEKKIKELISGERTIEYETNDNGVVEVPFVGENNVVTLYNFNDIVANDDSEKWEKEAS